MSNQATSTLWPTVIGAGAALAGGFLAAWWQTSRADKVAQKIRRAERREEGLLALSSTVTMVVLSFDALYQEAARGQTAAQYVRASELIRQLRELWYGTSSGIIPDRPVRRAFEQLEATVSDALLGDFFSQDRADELSTGDKHAGERLVKELGYVSRSLYEFRHAVLGEVAGLLGRPRPQWVSAAAIALWSWPRRTGARRRRGHQL